MNALAGFLCASCRLGLTACMLCIATGMRPVCFPCLDTRAPAGLHVSVLRGCMSALAGFLCVSGRLGLTACTLCMATCIRAVCFSFLGAGAPPGLHVLAFLAACTPLLASCALLKMWLDCIYALRSYMYAASLVSMLRCTCGCRAACIGCLAA
jgi:hypothetical protein